jgi:uncharacterized heparinase superfamily protein
VVSAASRAGWPCGIGFGWLADLIGIGAAARDPARALVQSWLAESSGWHPIAWRSDVVATRVFAWIVHFEEIAGRETDRPLRRAMLASIARQVRHLSRTAAWELAGAARLRALKGLVGGLAALGGPEKRMARALRTLERELLVQILPDGGHRTRSPSVQLTVLRDLIDSRAVLRAAQVAIPGPLQQAIERMAPMLRFFRHGDRRLALFNNSVEEDGVVVDLALTRSETRGHPPMQAPHSGFQRLQAGQSLVLVDTGKPPPRGFDGEAHAGTAVLRAEPGAWAHYRQLRRISRRKADLAPGGAVERGAFGAGRPRYQRRRDQRRGLARPGPRIGTVRARRGGWPSMDRRHP